MKKKILLIIGMLLLLTGCGSDLPLTGTAVQSDTSVAKINYNEEELYFDNFTDAWAYVNEITDANITLTLLTDWIADENGSFGSGVGYGTTGNLEPVDRKKKSIQVTIDLNGHTLDRNLDEKIKSGNVMSIKKDGVYTIKNGVITGGNTLDRGGALWLDNDETTVNIENITITDNHAEGNGGGIFVKTSDIKVNIKDTTIINNDSSNYGGGMYIAKQVTSVSVSGVVVIKDNTGKNNRNNLTLQKKDAVPPIDLDAALKSCTKLEEGSVIYVSASNFNAERIAINALKESENYFVSDNPEYKIKYVTYSGGLSDLYLSTKD